MKAPRAAASLIALVCAAFHEGCTTTGLALQDRLVLSLGHTRSNPPADGLPATRTLTASTDDWKVSVAWNPASLQRTVTWSRHGSGFTLVVPLQERPAPFTYVDKSTEKGVRDIQMTSYGPAQPACDHVEAGRPWAVVMKHEQVDFPSAEDLIMRLKWKSPEGRVLSPGGTLVHLRVDNSEVSSLSVEIEMLTVNGRLPSPEVLKPFLQGKFSSD